MISSEVCGESHAVNAKSLEDFRKEVKATAPEPCKSQTSDVIRAEARCLESQCQTILLQGPLAFALHFKTTAEMTGNKEIEVIRIVRALAGLGLKEAKKLVDGPTSLSTIPSLTLAEALDGREQLKQANITGKMIVKQTGSNTAYQLVPSSVLELAHRYQTCAHFAGEEGYDEERVRFIENAMTENRCHELKEDADSLQKEYTDNQNLTLQKTVTEIVRLFHVW